jgi:hypothetical protein
MMWSIAVGCAVAYALVVFARHQDDFGARYMFRRKWIQAGKEAWRWAQEKSATKFHPVSELDHHQFPPPDPLVPTHAEAVERAIMIAKGHLAENKVKNL